MTTLVPIKEIKSISDKLGIEIIYAEKGICDINHVTTPEHCGVYIITTESGKRYIGSSKNILKRLLYHISESGYRHLDGKVKMVDVYLTERKCQSKILEEFFIKELKPELNVLKYRRSYLSKTAMLDDSVHMELKEAQMIIFRDHGKRASIPRILATIVNDAKGPREIAKMFMEWCALREKASSKIGENGGNNNQIYQIKT